MGCGCSCWCSCIRGSRGLAAGSHPPAILIMSYPWARKLAQASGGIGAGRKRCNGCARTVVCGNLRGRRLRNPDSCVPVDMIFGARPAIALSRVLIALAGKLVTTTDTVAVARFGCGFDCNEWHRISREKIPCGCRSREEGVERTVGDVACRANRAARSKLRASLCRLLSAVFRTRNKSQLFRFFRCARRKGEPMFSRSSCQCCSGMERKTLTILGSNWVPAQRRISSLAWAIGSARR